MQKLHGKLDKLDQVNEEVCQEGQLGHAKNNISDTIRRTEHRKNACQY